MIGVSIVAAVLGVTLLQAFTLEIGFFLFFLPYTMFYNWAYDTLREKFLKRRQQRRARRANSLAGRLVRPNSVEATALSTHNYGKLHSILNGLLVDTLL